MLPDAWRLAYGTLTAFPARPPRLVDRRVAGRAMALAPLVVVPLGVLVGLVALTDLQPLLKGLLAVGVLALCTRAFHLDGLADTVDGLSASHDRERSLAVMKTGDVGPAGAVALILVLGIQAVGFASLLHGWRGGLLAGGVVLTSRAALATCCAKGVPSARPGGLGDTYTGTVPLPLAGAWWMIAAVVLAVAGGAYGLPWWRGGLAAVVGCVGVCGLIAHARRRLGGVTGDVFGAAIELCLAAILAVLA